MNDISVKIEESVKDPAAEASPSAEQGGENEEDPLAIEEAEAGEAKDPLTEPSAASVDDAATEGICDENAKEVKTSENNDVDETVAFTVEKVEGKSSEFIIKQV